MNRPDPSKWVPFDEHGDCEGNRAKCGADGCPKYGRLPRKPSRDGRRRVRGCDDPTARGLRSKLAGGEAQRRAAKQLGINVHGLHGGHEENYGGLVRIEVKHGGQVARAWGRYTEHCPVPAISPYLVGLAALLRPPMIFLDREGTPIVAATAAWWKTIQPASAEHVEDQWHVGGIPGGPILTMYERTKAQSEVSRPIGDHRPFVCCLAPKGTREVLVIGELSATEIIMEATR